MVGIYKITNIETGRIYIGQSVDVQKRLKQHGLKCLKWYIDRAINKYGRNAFTFQVIQQCAIEQLDDRQRYYISLYKSNERKYGYNQTSGGSPKQYSSVKIIRLDTLQIYDSMSQCARQLGLIEGDISRCCNGRMNNVKGIVFQFYQNYINGNLLLRQKLPRMYGKKRVRCVQLDQVFDSCHQAADVLGLKFRNISAVCNGDRITHGGYHFEYV